MKAKIIDKSTRELFENPKFKWVKITQAWTKRADKKSGVMLEGGFVLGWVAKGIGFGEVTFSQKSRDGRPETLYVESRTERMGKEFARKVLEHFLKGVKVIE